MVCSLEDYVTFRFMFCIVWTIVSYYLLILLDLYSHRLLCFYFTGISHIACRCCSLFCEASPYAKDVQSRNYICGGGWHVSIFTQHCTDMIFKILLSIACNTTILQITLQGWYGSMQQSTPLTYRLHLACLHLG